MSDPKEFSREPCDKTLAFARLGRAYATSVKCPCKAHSLALANALRATHPHLQFHVPKQAPNGWRTPRPSVRRGREPEPEITYDEEE